MSSLSSSMSYNSNQNFDEHRWIIQIRRTLDEELENDDTEIPVSIFNVPKSLMISNPGCYTPQLVAIGPYHHWRPELYEMERYKLAAAKRTQKQIQRLKFQDIVEHVKKLEPRIRASYHNFLDLSQETIAWMMALDVSILLEFLQEYADKECGFKLARISSGMSHLVDYSGRKSAHNMILRDIVMLENQIPMFVLRKILEVQLSSIDLADNILCSILAGFCLEISPFKIKQEVLTIKISETSHLLDYLYESIVPKIQLETMEITEAGDRNEAVQDYQEYSFKNSSRIKDFFSEIWKLISKLNNGPVLLIKRLIFSKPMKLLLKLPWKILSNVPGFSILKQPVENLFSANEEEGKPDSEDSEKAANKPPLVEEITIPSVSELVKSGVRFVPTNGNILSISFDPKAVTLHLPVISLDIHSEVVLRNLVAYEASSAPGPLVFTRYTELMNGIIDTEEDVTLLRQNGVVVNRLKSDHEVANLWNGMSKSIRLTKVDFLDKVIGDVNKHYNSRWKVKVGKFLKIYVFGSWKFLTLVATVFFLVLTMLQAFCSVYSCARVFHIETTD